MSRPTEIPTVSIIEDGQTGEFVLIARSYGNDAPAGERLFRGYPRPDIRFRHADEQQAEIDAGKLRTYLAEHWGHGPSKKQAREQWEERVERVVDPVWEK